MNISDELTSRVISIAYGGEGVIKNNSLTGFVRGALPGELVKSKIIEIKKKHFRSGILEIIEPSPFRTAPPCPYFNKCGGCCYQHLVYEKQLEFKAAQLKELLQHIGKIPDVKISSIIPSPKIFNYRNQITLKVKSGKLGFIGIDNKTFTPISKCLITKEEINNKLPEIEKDLGKGTKVKKLNGEILIKCDTGGKVDYAFLESISEKAEYTLLQENIENKTYYFSLGTFFQTNPYILPSVLNHLKDILSLTPDTVLFDLYSGTGLFSIYLSSFVKNAYGIETNKAAVKLANKTAEINNIKNCRFSEGKTEDIMPKIYNQNKNNILILDPPRQGLSKDMLNYLKITYPHTKIKNFGVGIRPSKCVYVSCEPANLARDLNFLCGNGYEIKDIIIADMFPQTQYIETLVIFHKLH